MILRGELSSRQSLTCAIVHGQLFNSVNRNYGDYFLRLVKEKLQPAARHIDRFLHSI